MIVDGKHLKSVWLEGNTVRMINQSLLPHRFEIFESHDHQRTTRAVLNYVVRGAGAVAAAAAYAVAQAVIEAPEKEFDAYVETAISELLGITTSYMVVHAVERVALKVKKAGSVEKAKLAARKEAEAVADEDANACARIGELGAELVGDGYRVFTHGSSGWLASTDWGTSLSPVYTAKRQGKNVFVWVGEGRPALYGARLVAWELKEEAIPFSLVTDTSTGYFMARGDIDVVIVGCERITRSGDVVARIGTYEKAVLAKAHKIPFYVAAPLAAVDWEAAGPKAIEAEERGEEEILWIQGRDEVNALHNVTTAPDGTHARNPVFDVTPAKYVSGIITEKGILKPDKLKNHLPGADT
ncbi:MAG TPA: S-methyl-5-thioribose-1-phosphate isomerase [Spirochaetia bacterium]|nr:S-methyl-5-thioribose-1-phosphate isomerase [Spirochaetia bacterium]